MAWLRPPPVEIGADADGIPMEFHDHDHPLWTGPLEAYATYMTDRGWSLPTQDRMALIDAATDCPPDLRTRASPPRRRQMAVEGWAVDSGITSPRWPASPDHHRLRAMGLL